MACVIMPIDEEMIKRRNRPINDHSNKKRINHPFPFQAANISIEKTATFHPKPTAHQINATIHFPGSFAQRTISATYTLEGWA